jgi:hypothetical protein
MQYSSKQRLQQPVEELDGHIAALRKRVEFLTGRERTPANSVAADTRGTAPARPRRSDQRAITHPGQILIATQDAHANAEIVVVRDASQHDNPELLRNFSAGTQVVTTLSRPASQRRAMTLRSHHLVNPRIPTTAVRRSPAGSIDRSITPNGTRTLAQRGAKLFPDDTEVELRFTYPGRLLLPGCKARAQRNG